MRDQIKPDIAIEARLPGEKWVFSCLITILHFKHLISAYIIKNIFTGKQWETDEICGKKAKVNIVTPGISLARIPDH